MPETKPTVSKLPKNAASAAEPLAFLSRPAERSPLDESYLQHHMNGNSPFSYLGVLWQPKKLLEVKEDPSATDKKTFN